MKRSALLLLLLPLTVSAQRNAKVPDPDPELERKALQLADGFEINLYAADPLLAKPIQMNFDPQGRLWIATSETYPQVKPGQKANDKILVIEDTNHDGKADKTTVFKDGLLIPTGVIPGNGGAYVANSTELLHLTDTDGDGKADRQRVILSGFGTEDTHHILHTLRWGFDGNLYMNQSIYIHSHIETPHGPRRLNGGGIWQFQPERYHLNVFARGWVNSWGHHFTRFGQSIVTDGAGGEGINYAIPGASYPTAVGAKRILHGLNPGSPKYCGVEVISGRHLPEDWRGNIITNDFRAHRVCRYVLRDEGSGYVAIQKPDLIKTKHPAFRPIDVKMGPDGAIYVADWYNPIIQHGEVDFRDPRRDKVHGRIWRITAKGRPLVKHPQLVKAKTSGLLKDLSSPEGWTRENARRVLTERGKKILPELKQWAKAKERTDEECMEALWLHQALDVIDENLLDKVLSAKDGRIRAAGVRVVSAWHEQIKEPLKLLSKAVNNPHPRARLEAVRALGQIHKSESAALALHALDHPMDHFLDYSLWLTMQELEPHWAHQLQVKRHPFGDKTDHLVFALESIDSPHVVPVLVDLLKRGKVPHEKQNAVLSLIATRGNSQHLANMLNLTVPDIVPVDQKVVLLRGLVRAMEERNKKPFGSLDAIGTHLASKNADLQREAAALAGLWKMELVRPQLTKIASDKSTSQATRQTVMLALARLGGVKSLDTLHDLSGMKQPRPIREAAVIALAELNLPTAIQQAVPLLTDTGANADPSEMVQALIRQRQGVTLLTKALLNQKMPADVARLAVRTIQTTGRKADPLLNVIRKAGNLDASARKLTPEQRLQWITDVEKLGDAARGEAIFRRATLSCMKCHAIGGAGGKVGPDLVSIGASAPVDYLLDSLLSPNKAIKENYHTLIVRTKRGQVLTGVKVRQTKTHLILRDAEDKEKSIALSSIEKQEQGTSLMPADLTHALTKAELLDLTRFLSMLGKVGDYQIKPGERIARRWQALEPTQETLTAVRRMGFGSTARPSPTQVWTAHYSNVSGVLPLENLPIIRAKLAFIKEPKQLNVVQCEVETSDSSKAKLRINSTAGLRLWINGEPRELSKEMTIALKKGVSRLTFVIDRGERDVGLRVEIVDAPEEKVRARFVSGK